MFKPFPKPINIMSLLALLIYLALIGFITWLIVTYIPLDPTIKKVITVAAIVGCIILCLYAFGLLGSLTSTPVPRIR